jgi:hypothetical protein
MKETPSWLAAVALLVAGGTAAADTLPSSWFGTWRGPCTTQIVGAAGPGTPFELELDIRPREEPDAVSWTMTYRGTGRQDVRPYVLRTVDAARGHFAVDEGRGVLLDTFLAGNVLMSHFQYRGTVLTSREELLGDRITVEFMSHDSAILRAIDVGDGQQITTNRAQSLQRCQLLRQ